MMIALLIVAVAATFLAIAFFGRTVEDVANEIEEAGRE